MQPSIADAQITALVPRCQHGDPAAIAEIYSLYADRLYRYILARVGDPDSAADLTTELFLRVLERIGHFRLNQRRPAASFSAWLYQIGANLVVDHYRQEQRQPEVALGQQLQDIAPIANPERMVAQKETLSELATAINQLTEEQRLIITAKFAEEMSNDEIANWLGRSVGAIKSMQHRALRTLARILITE